MPHIVLFHSILGLRDAEREIATAFEKDGHKVVLPDLFAGRTAPDYDAAFAMKKEIGHDAIMARAKVAVDAAPADAVLAGVSFGASLIGEFWGARPVMKGAILFAGAADWMTPRRFGFKVSAHIALPDPFDDEAFLGQWEKDAGPVDLQMHRYSGTGHYFLDRALPDYNSTAAELALQRSREFLKSI